MKNPFPADSTPETRAQIVADLLVKVATDLGIGVRFERPSGCYRHGDLIAEGTSHSIVVEDDGIQFRKSERRGRESRTRDLSEGNIRRQLREVLELMRKEKAAADAYKKAKDDTAARIVEAKARRSAFTADLNARGITSNDVRKVAFDLKRDAAALGRIPTFDVVDDGTFGVVIFAKDRTVFALVYARAEMKASFPVESVDEAVRIITGLDALFAK